MYLKSLEVHGFKSFANKLLFEFHNGITAIVGPNGSGKSNVADAVRWVLGEQSAKQLRGAKMEDVIFAGTQMRKPLGYAYVAITISNEDHKLNVPYEEVKIARRVYRSGESEYLLNGASCRLKDIQELLFDTGIGKEGYSIIGQGQIDKILSGKPEERRELFDEAAGIVKYKKRKAAAEKNLEEENQNLVRIEDILSELDKQVEPLRLQSEKAKEYLGYRDELRNLDINFFLTEYNRIHQEILSVEEKEQIANNDLEETIQQFEKTKQEYIAVEKEIEEHNQSLEEKREKLATDRVLLNQSQGEIKVLQEQINTVHQNKMHHKEQLISLQERIENAQKEKKEYELQSQDVEQEIVELKEVRQKINEKHQKILEDVSVIENEINQCNKERIAFLNENTDVKTNQERIKTLIEQNNQKKAEVTKRILENKTEAARLNEVLAKEKSILDDLMEKKKEIESIIAELRVTAKEIEKNNNTYNQEYHEMQRKFHMENSRLVSLRNLTERYEGFGQSIKRVMEQKKNYQGIIGVVADIIRVKHEYELAVETALGGSIQNIVTDNEQTAKAMIEHLKKNRYGRATFLPLTNMKAKPMNLTGNIMNEPGVIGMASELVDADDKFSNLIEYLLGRILVVDHIDHAIALAKKYHHTVRIVTIEGDLLNPGGSMSGGAFRNNNNLLGRRREMEELEKSVSEWKEKLELLSATIKENEKEKNDIEKKLSNDEKIKQEIQLKQNTAKINYDRAFVDLEKNKEKYEFIKLETIQIEERNNELQNDIAQINEKMQSNEMQSKESEDKILKLNQDLEASKKRQEESAKENADVLLKITSQEQAKQFVEENIVRMQSDIQQLENEIEIVNENGKDAEKQVEDKELDIKQTNEKIKKIQENIENLEKDIEIETQKREEQNKIYKGFFEKRESLSDKKASLEKENFRLANQKEKLNERIDSYTNYMWEQYELTYHTAEEKKIAVNLSFSEIKEQIAKLKNQMRLLGDVNINAIEQYKEVYERYDLLKTQHDDLIQSAEVLVGIIKELDVEMRKQFEIQFAEIRERFNYVFKELFGGGRGTLELTEDEDILLAGIKIVAQPPGKKLQNMMQLSGGEKALTAIALLFAIQSLKPSPFCLLDEIEAALDDSNVSRYAEYLHKLTKDTQFIVITHRRGTMNAADILYGITMQEKGVSTLVSVNLLDEKEIAK